MSSDYKQRSWELPSDTASITDRDMRRQETFEMLTGDEVFSEEHSVGRWVPSNETYILGFNLCNLPVY